MTAVITNVFVVEDAVLAAECGAAGILVSTHGGRQLDTIPASVSQISSVFCFYSCATGAKTRLSSYVNSIVHAC